MKTKKFNPDKLKSARLYEGYTIEKLAEAIEVTKQAVSLFEKGEITPKLETLMKLSQVLQFPRDYFFSEDQEVLDVGNVYFRAQMSTTRITKASQTEKIKTVFNLYKKLNKYIKFPKLNLPYLEVGEFDNLSEEDIEALAQKVRAHWDLGQGPINNLVGVLEKNGIIVTSFETKDEKVDAYSKPLKINGEIKYCIVLDEAKKSAARRQFNAAHELGHILLHEAMGIEVAELDNIQYKEMENQANLFAAALLMPKETFLNDLLYPNNLDHYIELKKKWRVSIAAMVVRAHKLGVITNNQYQYLMRKMNQNGYRKNEPLDDVLLINKPLLFRKALEMILSNNIATPNQILEEFAMFSGKTEELLGLPSGLLVEKQQDENIIDLRLVEESKKYKKYN